jgi:hypothetical protein
MRTPKNVGALSYSLCSLYVNPGLIGYYYYYYYYYYLAT